MKIGRFLDIDINGSSFNYYRAVVEEHLYNKSYILTGIYDRCYSLLYDPIKNSLIENENR